MTRAADGDAHDPAAGGAEPVSSSRSGDRSETSGGALTVVVYHHVRDPGRWRFPRLPGVDLQRFRAQLDWAMRSHVVVRMEDVLDALGARAELPPRALLLTFDDGYLEHHDVVMPILDDLGLQGSFFPVADAVDRDRVLSADAIQLVLAQADDHAAVVGALLAWLRHHRSEHDVAEEAHYLRRFARPRGFDGPEAGFVKRMLQHALPGRARREALAALFARFVGEDEAALAEQLYASREALTAMRRHGMHVGGHGASHSWLTSLPEAERAAEIDASLALLRDVGADLRRWTFSYPYGGFDDPTSGMLRARGCAAAFTVEAGSTDPRTADPLRLPRFDTNDLPPSD